MRMIRRWSAGLLTFVAVAASAVLAAGRQVGQTPPLSLELTIPLPQVTGGMNHLAADAQHQRVFVTATDNKSVVVVNLKSAKVERVLEGARPAAVEFAPDLNQLCVSGGGGISIYDGNSFQLLKRIDLDRTVDELRYNPKDKQLYAGVMDQDNPGIAIIDLPQKNLIAEVRLPAKPQGFAVEESGTRVFANTPGADQVTVVDRRAEKVIASWKLGDERANYPAALDEINHRLFVACRRPARLLVLDTENGKIVASIESGSDADDMSFDAASRRVFIACGEGMISVIQQADANHYKRLGDVQTAEGARNGVWIPELHRFALAVPRMGNKPAELRVFSMVEGSH